jgi:hypothetical protein
MRALLCVAWSVAAAGCAGGSTPPEHPEAVVSAREISEPAPAEVRVRTVPRVTLGRAPSQGDGTFRLLVRVFLERHCEQVRTPSDPEVRAAAPDSVEVLSSEPCGTEPVSGAPVRLMAGARELAVAVTDDRGEARFAPDPSVAGQVGSSTVVEVSGQPYVVEELAEPIMNEQQAAAHVDDALAALDATAQAEAAAAQERAVREESCRQRRAEAGPGSPLHAEVLRFVLHLALRNAPRRRGIGSIFALRAAGYQHGTTFVDAARRLEAGDPAVIERFVEQFREGPARLRDASVVLLVQAVDGLGGQLNYGQAEHLVDCGLPASNPEPTQPQRRVRR